MTRIRQLLTDIAHTLRVCDEPKAARIVETWLDDPESHHCLCIEPQDEGDGQCKTLRRSHMNDFLARNLDLLILAPLALALLDRMVHQKGDSRNLR